MNFQRARRKITQETENKTGHCQGILSGARSAFDDAQGGDPRQRRSGMTPNFITACGFTLIEVLVVVLIIGILAAVALPQYQKAVERSKATQGLAMLKTLAAAYQAAYLANGTYPSSFAELDVDFPLTGKEHFMIHSQRDSKSNSDWILEIEKTSQYVSLYAIRNSGKYKGAGFVVGMSNPTNSTTKLLRCYERISNANILFDSHLAEGAYCKQIIKGQFSSRGISSRTYKLP